MLCSVGTTALHRIVSCVWSQRGVWAFSYVVFLCAVAVWEFLLISTLYCSIGPHTVSFALSFNVNMFRHLFNI